MQKAKFERIGANRVVGTIGHAQHGKTTLTSAITKVMSLYGQAYYCSVDQIDKTPEERLSRQSIIATHVEYQRGNHYVHIDCPGNPKFVENMAAGVAQMDTAILVVSVVEGPQAQTREHLLLARQAGVREIIVYLTKTDLVIDPERIDEVEQQVRDLLTQCEYPGDAVLFFSGSPLEVVEDGVVDVNCLEAHRGSRPSILGLIDALDIIPLPAWNPDLPFKMSIENTYFFPEGGVVVGRILQGKVRIGNDLHTVGLKPELTKTVIGLEICNRVLDQGVAGDLVSVMLRGVRSGDVKRGQILTAVGSMEAHTQFESWVRFLTSEEGGRHTELHSGYTAQFHFGATEVTGTVTLPEDITMVLPGDCQAIRVTLSVPAGISVGQGFTMRDGITVGTGTIDQIIG